MSHGHTTPTEQNTGSDFCFSAVIPPLQIQMISFRFTHFCQQIKYKFLLNSDPGALPDYFAAFHLTSRSLLPEKLGDFSVLLPMKIAVKLPRFKKAMLSNFILPQKRNQRNSMHNTEKEKLNFSGLYKFGSVRQLINETTQTTKM